MGARAGTEIKVGVQETAKLRTRVLLLLIGAPPILQRVQGQAIWTGYVNYISIFLNVLAIPLGLELSKL